jgi:hypothetical protein
LNLETISKDNFGIQEEARDGVFNNIIAISDLKFQIGGYNHY